jgi:inner membrane protein
MMWKTHLAFGLVVALVLLPIFKPANNWIFVSLILFASLLPDIDHTESKFGRKVKIIGYLFKHRGIFHSIFAVALFSYPFYHFGYVNIALPILIGYVTHLVGDMITKQGIMPFYPIPLTVKGFMNTNSWTETCFLFLFLGISAWIFFS